MNSKEIIGDEAFSWMATCKHCNTPIHNDGYIVCDNNEFLKTHKLGKIFLLCQKCYPALGTKDFKFISETIWLNKKPYQTLWSIFSKYLAKESMDLKYIEECLGILLNMLSIIHPDILKGTPFTRQWKWTPQKKAG